MFPFETFRTTTFPECHFYSVLITPLKSTGQKSEGQYAEQEQQSHLYRKCPSLPQHGLKPWMLPNHLEIREDAHKKGRLMLQEYDLKSPERKRCATPRRLLATWHGTCKGGEMIALRPSMNDCMCTGQKTVIVIPTTLRYCRSEAALCSELR